MAACVALATLAWLALDLPWADVAVFAAMLLALLAVLVPMAILSNYGDGTAEELPCSAARTLLVTANGESAWFRADDMHATLLWSELAGVTEDADHMHFHRTDGTQVQVARVAGYEHVLRAARLVVAQRRQTDEATLDRMARGLSPAEESADADRGLSVSR